MSGKVPYSESFEGDAQVSLEERISARVSEVTEGSIHEEVCNEIGKEALYVVVSELRPDLLIGRKMTKKQIEEFAKLMNVQAYDYGMKVKLTSADEEGFAVEMLNEEDESDGVCRFKFNGAMLCLEQLYDSKVNWLVSPVPAAAFALCYAGHS